MKVLVVGGTGKVGSEVTRCLLESGVSVRVLSRQGLLPRALPPGSDVEAAAGDLERPDSFKDAFSGIDAVFLLTAQSKSESTQGLAAVEAARNGGASKIVYMSVRMPPGSEIIPHFAAKIPVEQAVRESGLKWTILRPNDFFQNDFALKEPITAHGVYPIPIGNVGLTRIDVRDVADGAVNALLSEEHEGQVYSLNGPRAWTGEDTAREYADHLGRSVRYGGDDLGAWARQMSGVVPEWLVGDLQIMYGYFQKYGFEATPEELELQRRLLGHDPRAYETFVWEVARGWRAAVVNRPGQ